MSWRRSGASGHRREPRRRKRRDPARDCQATARRRDADDDRVGPRYRSARHLTRRASTRCRTSPPVGLFASLPLFIFAHPTFQPTVSKLCWLAKEKPDAIGFTSQGIDSIQHLSIELLAYLRVKLCCALSQRRACAERHASPATSRSFAGVLQALPLDLRPAPSSRSHNIAQAPRLLPNIRRRRGRRRQLPDLAAASA